MKNLTMNDSTQIEIIKHLKITEKLLYKTSSKLSGREMRSEIIALPDLGIPRNITRVLGGFYTGAFYSWESDVPFIPIDSTVNYCGVSVYKLKNRISSQEEFDKLINKARKVISDSSIYIWNYNSSNHFITYGDFLDENSNISEGYVVLHSSSCEFKDQYNGLYPTKGNWYFNNIEFTYDEENNRYLRYIKGSYAERFIKLANMVKEFNYFRNEYIAEIIFDSDNIEKKILNIDHYGLVETNSVSIGCQLLDKNQEFLLLTNCQKPMYLIKNGGKVINQISLNGNIKYLTPHGLGVKLKDKVLIKYLKDSIYLDNTKFTRNDKFVFDKDIVVRDLNKEEILNNINCLFPGSIKGVFYPKFTHDRFSK